MVVVGYGASTLEVRADRVVALPQTYPPPVVAFYLDDTLLGRVLVEDASWRTYRLPVNIAPGRYRLRVCMLSHNGRDAVGLDWLRLR